MTRGRTHTTLTETAALVVYSLKKYSGIKMIAPGLIDAKRAGKRHITVVYTRAGFQLLISGSGVQKVAVHLVDHNTAPDLISNLRRDKALKHFTWAERTKTHL